MYISTTYYIGDSVYFYDAASDCVTRATVREICTTQYKHAICTVYVLNVLTDDGPQDLARDESDLHRDAGAAFRANPLPEPAPEVAEAA